MDETFLTTGIILDKQPWGEKDAKAVLYSRERGLLPLVIRGSQKLESKLSAASEPFNLVEVMVVVGNTKDYLGGINLANSFFNLKKDYQKIIYASRLSAFILKLIKQDGLADEAIYQTLLDYFWLSNQAAANQGVGRLLLLAAKLKILTALGLMPEFNLCSQCASSLKEGGYFLPNGELLCSACKPIDDRYFLILPKKALANSQAIIENNLSKGVRQGTWHSAELVRMEQLVEVILLNQT